MVGGGGRDGGGVWLGMGAGGLGCEPRIERIVKRYYYNIKNNKKNSGGGGGGLG